MFALSVAVRAVLVGLFQSIYLSKGVVNKTAHKLLRMIPLTYARYNIKSVYADKIYMVNLRHIESLGNCLSAAKTHKLSGYFFTAT